MTADEWIAWKQKQVGVFFALGVFSFAALRLGGRTRKYFHL
jgi:hypothetical protein